MEKTQGPRKKLRLADPSQQSPFMQTRLSLSHPVKFNILTLSDELLSLILFHLGASNTGGTLQGPRHAFTLAQTNTRLFHLFRMFLTRITPHEDNPTPPTLRSSHMLSVARLAGNTLRELHLPECCNKIVPQLVEACPFVVILSLFDDLENSEAVFAEVVRLPLRSLTISHPSPECLSVLTPPPPELSLNVVYYLSFPFLRPVLSHPPKRFNLEIDLSEQIPDQEISELVSCMREAIPKMESVSLKGIPGDDWDERHDFVDEAMRLISAARENQEDSACKSIKLQGCLMLQFLQKVHPKALLELTCFGYTLVDHHEGGAYIQKLPLGELYLMMDVSRVQEVIIEKHCDPRWKEQLSSVKLKRAFVTDLMVAADMCLAVETVEIPLQCFSGHQWGWMGGVRKVRIVARRLDSPKFALVAFFESLASLLHQFQGNEVWIAPVTEYCCLKRAVNVNLEPLAAAVLSAAKAFEERGGDAGTIKPMADYIRMVFSSPRLGIESS